MNTLHSCNFIQVEGWLPSTWMTLHGGNVVTLVKCISSWSEEKQLKHVNVLKCLPLALKKTLQECKVKHSKHVKTRESSIPAEYTWLLLKV